MNNVQTINKLAARSISVKIENRNQEKEFIHICRERKIPIMQRSKDFFNTLNGKPVFPIYYIFFYHEGILLNWNTVRKEEVRKKSPILLDVNCFELNLKEEVL